MPEQEILYVSKFRHHPNKLKIEAQTMLLAILTELHKTSAAIEASWIVSSNGLTLASIAPADADEDRAAATCSGVLSFAERTVKDLARGVLEMVSLKSGNGYILLTDAGKQCVLVVLTQSGAELDAVFPGVESAAEKFKNQQAVTQPQK